MANLLGPSAFGAARATPTRPAVTPNNSGSDTWWLDCSSPTARDGTEVRAGWLNSITALMRNVIRGGGVTEDNTDEMLSRAIRSQRYNYATAAAVSGGVNAITLAFDPVFPSLGDLDGVPIRFVVEGAPNGAVTIAVDGLSALPLVDTAGTALGAGSLASGQLIEVMKVGANFVMLAGQRSAPGGSSTPYAPLASAVEATMTANQTNIVSAADVTITYQTLNRSQLRSSTWTSNSRLTIGADEGGLWYVQAAWTWFPPANGIYNVARIKKNGSTYLGESAVSYVVTGTGYVIQASTVIPLVAGDYIEAIAYHQAGSTQTAVADPRSRFYAQLISATN